MTSAALCPTDIRLSIEAIRFHGNTLVDGIIVCVIVEIVIRILPRLHGGGVTKAVPISVSSSPSTAHVVDQGIKHIGGMLEREDVSGGQTIIMLTVVGSHQRQSIC